MIPLARLGDLHVCLLPGHGTTPVVTGSPDVKANDYLIARIGDICACGAVIVCGFPKVLVNDRPAAHFGSPTSHGGIIMTGSADIFGSYNVSGEMTDTVIDFQKMGAISPEGVLDETKLFVLLGDAQLREKAVAAKALVDLRDPDDIPEQPCPHPDMMEQLANYIADEMNRNIHHPSVLEMKELNSYDAAEETRKYFDQPFYLTMGHSPNFNAIGAAKTAQAFALWTERVGQNRPWDHKPKIKKLFDGSWQKQGAHDYFHDIWSNIHYGFVGMAAGFSESVLFDGAGLEQIVSDSVRKVQNPKIFPGPSRGEGVEGLRAWDDAPDRISIQIGVDLYKTLSMVDVTGGLVMSKVLAVPISGWKEGVHAHKCR